MKLNILILVTGFGRSDQNIGDYDSDGLLRFQV